MVQIQGQEEYIVHKVLNSKIKWGKLWYLIDWDGYSLEEHTWEPAENVHTPILVQASFGATLRNLDPHHPVGTCRDGSDVMTHRSQTRACRIQGSSQLTIVYLGPLKPNPSERLHF